MSGTRKEKGKDGKGDGKGKGIFPWACHGCGEIGHRVADCPKNDKKAVNPLGESQDEDWEDEGMEDGWGMIAHIRKAPPGGRGLSQAPSAPPGLLTPTSNRWKALGRDDDKPDDDDDYDDVPTSRQHKKADIVDSENGSLESANMATQLRLPEP